MKSRTPNFANIPGAGRRGTRLGLSLALAFALTCSSAPSAYALDLLQGYRLAIQNDAKYQAARADAAASREAEPQAQAQLLPNLSASLARNDQKVGSWTPGFLGGSIYRRQDYISSNYAITLRQPLYRRYSFAMYRQAQAQVASAEANLDRNLQDLLVRLSGAYFDALMAEDQSRLVIAQKEAFTAQLKSATRRFAAGQNTRTDIDDAQARYDMALAQELEANQNIDYTRRQLQLIVKQPVNNLAALAPARIELMPPHPAVPEEWIQRSEEVNADLRALRANIQAAEQEVAKASAGHHPTVDLIAQRSRTQSASENTINQGYLTNTVGLQVNIPIFTGGYNSSMVRQAEAILERTRQQYEARRREIELEVRKEFQNVAQGVLKVKAQEQAERSADQAVFSNQKGFQAGTRTLVDILNAEQQRMNVRRDLANARHQYILARIKLQGLAGSLNEDEITTVNQWLDKTGRDPEPEPAPAPALLTPPESTPGQPENAAPPVEAAPTSALLTPQRQFERKSKVLAFKVRARNCATDNTSPPSPFAASDKQSLHFPLIETCSPEPALNT